MEMGNNLTFKWIVYQTTCLVNNKIYIGVHKTKDPDIFDGYIGNGYNIGWTINNPKTAFEFALKKYGYKNFLRTTLKVFDNEDAAYELEEKIVDRDFIKRHDNYNISLGGKHAVIYKTFYQYNLNGDFIKKWDSREEIINFYKCFTDNNKIRRAIDNKWSVFDSYWSDKYYEKLDISDYKVNLFSSIYKFDKNGNILEIYQDCIEASKFNDVPVNSIYTCLNKKCILKDCFYTKDPGDIQNIIKLYELTGLGDKTISIYTSDKKLFKSFVSIKQLVSYLNCSQKDVKYAIKNETLINGYYVQYGFYETFGNHKEPGVKVAQYDLNGNLIKVWNTIAECTKEHPKVRLVLKGIRKQTHGYTFKIID